MVMPPHPAESHSESTPHSPAQRPARAPGGSVLDWSGGQSRPLDLAEELRWALLTC